MSRPVKHLPPLPAERALKVISGRWKAIVLYHLFSGPQRLSTLGRLMPAINQKVLIQLAPVLVALCDWGRHHAA
ncbi:MAG: hypothetical protein CFE45_00400 [Burkholderiales bacterium PBB5]|nr:MAG: hypothetical protein CFE45_00400 [Burkholderiales bacterium PBB5]